ncbi:MAG TPA: adenosylcobinamide-GDP ribazoletransferase [Leucothrix sp.]|nr:adenosylcobinamide-GDP ribazoletransferase [Leucothrix sp.]HIQ15729.1 adenosylcobinamide-GDP ribazoletransferase [Leucothrix sp.]
MSQITNHPYAKAFLLALALLTRLPLPQFKNIQASDSGRSALFYPLVGLVIGLILYLPILFFSQAPPLLLAAIITVLWAVITGGLHLDGLADSADGWLGGMGDKDKALKIMKDPVVGAAGSIAITCMLLLKFAVLTAILQQTFHDIVRTSGIIIFAPFLGRAMILLLILLSNNANPNSMANDVVNHLSRNTIGWLIGACVLIAAFFSLSGLLFALVSFWLIRKLMYKHLGGYTGDTLGATVEITEVMYLIGYALLRV